MSNLQKTIAETFLQMAEGLETGSFGPAPKIALTGMGSEHGEKNAMAAAVEASKAGVDVVYLGAQFGVLADVHPVIDVDDGVCLGDKLEQLELLLADRVAYGLLFGEPCGRQARRQII